ncbi:uncharacterized protein BXZ73DRAFT_100869 [Epithele typhae]|uniref:uncharacterized protein n=1 Tax=Epithele typhae TaxID=378194 RepID=UPI0020087753|nr:uncharacterized protein BXZ73DRAFT_100869 [Epithele typhae]KAH9934030.1 hypothetical protein BXZ73DRAFT_100869 [Epithele typhae]
MSGYSTLFQHSLYIANNISAVLYGVYLSLYYLTVRFAIDDYRRAGAQYGRSHRLFVCISTVLLFMITLWIVVKAIFGQEMWVVNENYPGGAQRYYLDHTSAWYYVMPGSVSLVSINAIADAFLLYRLTVVWSPYKVVLIVPSVLYIATLGVTACVLSARANFFTGTASRVGVGYVSMSLSLNVYCTVLICARMWWFSRVIRHALGRQISRKYSGAASIIIESILPYTVFTTAYLVALGLSSPVEVILLGLQVLFSVLSPQMIMLRVLIGRALTGRDPITATFGYDDATDATDLPSVLESAPGTSDPAVVYLSIVSQFSCTKSSDMNV